MHRIDAPDHTVVGGLNRFIDQNLPGIPGTVISANWANAVQEEIAAVIEAAGITLAASGSADTWGQLHQAIFNSNALGANALAANSVGASELADNAVDTDALQNEAVVEAKLADDAVTARKLADNAVDTAAIVNKAVTSAKLADGAVGNAQLATNAVATGNIQTKAVTADKLADAAVGDTQMASMSISKLLKGTTNISETSGLDTYTFQWGNLGSTWEKTHAGWYTERREESADYLRFKKKESTTGALQNGCSINGNGLSVLKYQYWDGVRSVEDGSITMLRASFTYAGSSGVFNEKTISMPLGAYGVDIPDILSITMWFRPDGAVDGTEKRFYQRNVNHIRPEGITAGKAIVNFDAIDPAGNDGYGEFLIIIDSRYLAGV